MIYWKPYVPVAKRRANALKEVKKLQKKGKKLSPVENVGRTITKTFWGNAWCENLEAYSDYENRLPRGRTYVRNGSVVDLQIESCKVNALVSGSSMYRIDIRISKLSAERWKTAKKLCTGSIGSLVELLQGKFSSAVMKSMCDKKTGLFPSTKDITMRCSCPDGALTN